MRRARRSRDSAAPPMSGAGADAPAVDAHAKALQLLARREHSRAELRRKLLGRDYPPGEVDAALAALAAEGWLSNARFAEMLVRSRLARGWGPRRLRQELARHEIDADTIAALLDAGADEASWGARARAQLERRFGAAPAADYNERARRARFLARRGFPAGIARAAAWGEVDDDET